MSVTEHPQKSRIRSGWDLARARVVQDFRDFRFTWGGFLKWSGITVLAFLTAAIITLYFLDWNQLRGPIGRYLSSRTGREVRIDGNLSVKLFTWQPSVDVGQVFIGNPAWVGTPQAAKFTRARVEVRLVPLLFGDIILPLVRIDQPQLLVVRDAGGRTNWDSKSGANPNDAFKLPPIRRFIINNGHVEIRDAVRKLHFTGTVSSTEEAGSKRASFALTGDGTLNANKFLANVQGGPLLNVDESKPYSFDADVHAGATHAVVHGAITQPFHLDRFTSNINVTGPDLSELYFMTGLVLPKTPPYHLTLSAQREGNFYRLTDISAILGSTDLEGNLTVDASHKVPALAGKVASRVLNFADLGPLIGGGKAQTATSKYLLPDTALHTERLKQTNAEVDYSAASIKSRDFPLTSLDTHISVKDAVLNLKPLAFGFTQGKLSGSLKVDARKEVPVTSVDARLTDLKAENFIKGSDKPIQGTLEARAVLTGSGNSVHKVASSADGTFTAVVPQGGMRHSLAEWMGIDVLKALSLNLGDDNSNTQLRCAVAGFGIRNGLMTSQSFVLDTEPVRVDGSGSINLADETLNLRLQGAPKHFQFVRLRAPITVKGSLAHPAIGVDTRPAIAQGGLALALGFINPAAALLAFVDPGLAKDANCGPLLADAKAKGAPVKASAVRNAPAPRK
jgi:uncharacterized protein involved in outer membrane biogenesis